MISYSQRQYFSQSQPGIFKYDIFLLENDTLTPNPTPHHDCSINLQTSQKTEIQTCVGSLLLFVGTESVETERQARAELVQGLAA